MTSIREFDQVRAPRGGRILLPAALLALAAGACLAQSAENLRITVGQSIVIDYPADIRQISTSNPEIVDASPVTTREILMHGKGLGTATMVVWSRNDQRTFYQVTVEINVDPLRRILQETFPTERIELHNSRDSIALTGTVSSKDVADRSVALAAPFAKTVVNNLQLTAPGVEKQILLRVKFAELDRSRAAQYGVNILSRGATNTVGSVSTRQFNSASVLPTDLDNSGTFNRAGTINVSDALNIFAFRPDLNLAAFIQALQTESILQILAEPNLVTANGKEATFLVGGEFPLPILQGGATSGAVTVAFREFGIRLLFTPQLTPNNTIKLYLKQEVSALDVANGVTLAGFFIPGLSTRRAETNVELAEGQSFIVAGLLDNRETENFSKLPVISSLPILGALFKSKRDNKQSTELVMLVTPELTMPLGPNDPKPIPSFPREFLKRFDPSELQPGAAKQSKR